MHLSLAGKFLIAMPGISDPRFERAVILVCSHSPQQAMGLVVNKPREELHLSDVLEHLGIPLSPPFGMHAVLDGGPVKPDRGYVLHSEDFEIESSTLPVAPGVRLTMTREVLEALGSQTPPAEFVLALGYAGWDGGQLEQELLANVWLVADAEKDLVFHQALEDRWAHAIRRLGLDPSQLSGEVGRA